MHPSTKGSHAEHSSPLEDVLRRHGAWMINRHGRFVAAHHGSPTSEVAVCLTTVGIADRCDRTTIELRGAGSEDVERALVALARLRIRTWWCRRPSGSAIVRCENPDATRCLDTLVRIDGTTAVDVSDEYAAIGIIGPRAAELLEACDFEGQEEPPIVLREGRTAFEVLVPAAEGSAQWETLLAVGAPYDIACVGMDALAYLAASHRLDSSITGGTPR